MTEQEFHNYFHKNILPIIATEYEKNGIPDRTARRERFNNEVDYFQKQGTITEEQAASWCISDYLENTLYWL